MRIVKKHDERKKELLDTAERLFVSKGYNQTTINDIRNEIGLAKGTFYHYFKSKEEILDAIIERVIDADVAKATQIAADNQICAHEKLQQILFAQPAEAGSSKARMTETAHKPDNEKMHIKTITGAVKRLSPIMADVARQGVAEGIYHTQHPEVVMDVLLISGQILFDEAIFDWPEGERQAKIRSYVHTIELLLGAPSGSFNYIDAMMNQQ